MKILVVEDEPDLNHIIAKHLQAEGYIVDSCFNGNELSIILQKKVMMLFCWMPCFLVKMDLKF